MSQTSEVEELEVYEHCGLATGYSVHPDSDLFNQVSRLAQGVKHRGSKGSGLHVHGPKGDYIFHHPDKLDIALADPELDSKRTDAPNTWITIHCRYGTSKGYGDENLQPIILQANDGQIFSVSHNGNMPGVHQLTSKQGISLPEQASDTVAVAYLLAAAPERDWDDRIINTLNQIAGAYCFLIGVRDRVYVARDRLGIRPLAEGQKDGKVYIASESYAHDLIGVTPTEVLPGTILRIDRSGITTLQPGQNQIRADCDLERAYFGHHESLSYPFDMTHFQYRYRCGQQIAREVNIPNRENALVVPIPDSGRAVGYGFANKKGLPLEELIVRNPIILPGTERSFLRDDEKERIRQRVLQKLIFKDSPLWQGARVWLTDDSVIRGSVSSVVIEEVFRKGAAEVYLLSGFPPFTFRCYLGISTRTQEELIAAHHRQADGSIDIDGIAHEIHPRLTGLFYISIVGFLKARGFTDLKPDNIDQEVFFRCNGCGGCITGQFPIDAQGILHPFYADKQPR